MSVGDTRSRLIGLLAEACELEHALSCSYLYAAFSLKRDISDGLDWREQQVARRWASRIYHVAAQEMLHLAQAWNLLAAVGGTAHYGRPAFPQPARRFPLNVALTLRRFDESSLRRFLIYESFDDVTLEDAGSMDGVLWPIDEGLDYLHVGQLYQEIARIIDFLPERELFVAPNPAQRATDSIDFHDIVRVIDRQTALAAIARITEQGEGTANNRADSHFGVFQAILAEVRQVGFDLALPVAENPFVRSTRRAPPRIDAIALAAGGVTATEITDVTAVHAVDLFDDVYVLMLQLLAQAFGGTQTMNSQMTATLAIELMTTVLKPLGEAICRLPSGVPGLNAGPTFEITRHVALPQDATIAGKVASERLGQLAGYSNQLMAVDGLPPVAAEQLAGIAGNLARLVTLPTTGKWARHALPGN